MPTLTPGVGEEVVPHTRHVADPAVLKPRRAIDTSEADEAPGEIDAEHPRERVGEEIRAPELLSYQSSLRSGVASRPAV